MSSVTLRASPSLGLSLLGCKMKEPDVEGLSTSDSVWFPLGKQLFVSRQEEQRVERGARGRRRKRRSLMAPKFLPLIR